jgi:membrane associated rhomboid family serine protease
MSPSQSRLQQQLQTLPPATLAILSVLGGVYVLQIVLDWNVRLYTFCPILIMEQHQLWRLVTSTVLHGSILHIAMNFMSAWGLCLTLERTLGTIPLLLTTMASMVGSSMVHLLLAVIPHVIIGYDPWFQEHSLGFSGVLFHYAAVEAAIAAALTSHGSNSNNNNTHSSSRSVLGLFTVSTAVYPWALLVALQMFMPNLSFLGHLSGLLTGTLQAHCFSTAFVGPSSSSCCGCHTATLEHQCSSRCRNFVPSTTTATTILLERSLDSTHNTTMTMTTTRSCRHVCSIGWTYIGYMVETLQVIICGRRYHDDDGDDATTTTIPLHHMESEFGDEWIGLPLSADSGDFTESRMT